MTGFNSQQLTQMETIMVSAVRRGLSDIGLGYDDETEKKAIRSDLDFIRSQRLGAESRRHNARRGFWNALGLSGVAAVLYCFAHFQGFLDMLTGLFQGGRTP